MNTQFPAPITTRQRLQIKLGRYRAARLPTGRSPISARTRQLKVRGRSCARRTTVRPADMYLDCTGDFMDGIELSGRRRAGDPMDWTPSDGGPVFVAPPPAGPPLPPGPTPPPAAPLPPAPAPLTPPTPTPATPPPPPPPSHSHVHSSTPTTPPSSSTHVHTPSGTSGVLAPLTQANVAMLAGPSKPPQDDDEKTSTASLDSDLTFNPERIRALRAHRRLLRRRKAMK
ncbi:hypothetical protein BSKO_11035 [Bryopsis sp. KO-2023]|nr:hypothetical protein BSKO_11035 [Bryopsis sp. KO-2023]